MEGDPEPVQVDGPHGHHRRRAHGRPRLAHRDHRAPAGRREPPCGPGAGDLDHPSVRPWEHGRAPPDRARLGHHRPGKAVHERLRRLHVGLPPHEHRRQPRQVIAFRAVQGLGSAILFTNSAAMIVDATPAEELGLSLGINQVAFRMGSMAGLTVSGIILSVLDWRALFYVNVPIGIFGTAWAHFRLREMAKLERGAPIDWGGFVAFTVFILSLLLALTVAAYGVSEAATIAGLLVLSAAGLSAFVFLERRHPHPLLDLKLLRIREFTGGLLAQMLNAIAFGAVLLLLSLYFQLVLDKKPLEAGL